MDGGEDEDWGDFSGFDDENTKPDGAANLKEASVAPSNPSLSNGDADAPKKNGVANGDAVAPKSNGTDAAPHPFGAFDDLNAADDASGGAINDPFGDLFAQTGSPTHGALKTAVSASPTVGGDDDGEDLTAHSNGGGVANGVEAAEGGGGDGDDEDWGDFGDPATNSNGPEPTPLNTTDKPSSDNELEKGSDESGEAASVAKDSEKNIEDNDDADEEWNDFGDAEETPPKGTDDAIPDAAAATATTSPPIDTAQTSNNDVDPFAAAMEVLEPFEPKASSSSSQSSDDPFAGVSLPSPVSASLPSSDVSAATDSLPASDTADKPLPSTDEDGGDATKTSASDEADGDGDEWGEFGEVASSASSSVQKSPIAHEGDAQEDDISVANAVASEEAPTDLPGADSGASESFNDSSGPSGEVDQLTSDVPDNGDVHDFAPISDTTPKDISEASSSVERPSIDEALSETETTPVDNLSADNELVDSDSTTKPAVDNDDEWGDFDDASPSPTEALPPSASADEASPVVSDASKEPPSSSLSTGDEDGKPASVSAGDSSPDVTSAAGESSALSSSDDKEAKQASAGSDEDLGDEQDHVDVALDATEKETSTSELASSSTGDSLVETSKETVSSEIEQADDKTAPVASDIAGDGDNDEWGDFDVAPVESVTVAPDIVAAPQLAESPSETTPSEVPETSESAAPDSQSTPVDTSTDPKSDGGDGDEDDDWGDFDTAPSSSQAADNTPSQAVDANTAAASDDVAKDAPASAPTDDDWGDFDAAPSSSPAADTPSPSPAADAQSPSPAADTPPSPAADVNASEGMTGDAPASSPADDDWGDFDAAPSPSPAAAEATSSSPPAAATPSPAAADANPTSGGGGWVDDDDGEWGSFEETPTPTAPATTTSSSAPPPAAAAADAASVSSSPSSSPLSLLVGEADSEKFLSAAREFLATSVFPSSPEQKTSSASLSSTRPRLTFNSLAARHKQARSRSPTNSSGGPPTLRRKPTTVWSCAACAASSSPPPSSSSPVAWREHAKPSALEVIKRRRGIGAATSRSRSRSGSAALQRVRSLRDPKRRCMTCGELTDNEEKAQPSEASSPTSSSAFALRGLFPGSSLEKSAFAAVGFEPPPMPSLGGGKTPSSSPKPPTPRKPSSPVGRTAKQSKPAASPLTASLSLSSSSSSNSLSEFDAKSPKDSSAPHPQAITVTKPPRPARSSSSRKSSMSSSSTSSAGSGFVGSGSGSGSGTSKSKPLAAAKLTRGASLASLESASEFSAKSAAADAKEAELDANAVPPGMWRCPVCTFDNTLARTICEMCGGKKPKVLPKPKPARKPVAPPADDSLIPSFGSPPKSKSQKVTQQAKSSLPSATDDFLSGLFGGPSSSSSTSISDQKSDEPAAGASFADDLFAQDLAAFVTEEKHDTATSSASRSSKSLVSSLLAPSTKSSGRREKEAISAEDLAKLMGDLPDYSFMLSKEISRK